MTAHLTLPVTHTFMMQSPRVIVQTLSVLNTGGFEPELSTGDALSALLDLGVESVSQKP